MLSAFTPNMLHFVSAVIKSNAEIDQSQLLAGTQQSSQLRANSCGYISIMRPAASHLCTQHFSRQRSAYCGHLGKTQLPPVAASNQVPQTWLLPQQSIHSLHSNHCMYSSLLLLLQQLHYADDSLHSVNNCHLKGPGQFKNGWYMTSPENSRTREPHN
jgi:hypothetical protein